MDRWIEALLVTLGIVVVLTVTYQTTKGRKRGDPRNYYMGKGQFFDPNSYIGTVRMLFLGLLVCVTGWYFDEIGRWIWHQFGSELIVPPEKERWHRTVSTTMGLTLIVTSLLELMFIARGRRRQKNEKEIEQLRQYHNSRDVGIQTKPEK